MSALTARLAGPTLKLFLAGQHSAWAREFIEQARMYQTREARRVAVKAARRNHREYLRLMHEALQ